MIDSVPLIQNANDAQQINASIIAMKKASRELDEKIVKLNSLNSELDKKIALLDSGLSKEIEDRKEAINSLDVPSVGGSGKYISAISETDGKISATASEITSSVSSGNSQPVTSGGVAETLNNPLIKTFSNNVASNKIIHLGHFTVPSWAINRCGLNLEIEARQADGSYRILGSVNGQSLQIGVFDVSSSYLNIYYYKTDSNNYDLYLLIGSYVEAVFVKMTEPLNFTYDGSTVSSYAGTIVDPIYSNSTNNITSGNLRPVTSNAVATGLESYLKCVKAYSVTSSTLDISDLPRGLYLCVFNNLYSSYERFNIGILCNWIMSQNAIKYTTIANDGITVSVNGSTITTNQVRIYGARFYRIGYARGTSDS